jgi:hypothetical protein
MGAFLGLPGKTVSGSTSTAPGPIAPPVCGGALHAGLPENARNTLVKNYLHLI